jgi:DnaJ-class molecular chaperone
MDYRDVAGHYNPILQDVNTRTMTATFTAEDADGNEIEHTVYLRYEVCDTCDGKGRYVNPAIDSHGLSREDFDEDPDFAEDYFSGVHDVECRMCHGQRVEPVVDELRTPKDVYALYQQREQDAWDDARQSVREREMGY